jgi:hypothetical protein
VEKANQQYNIENFIPWFDTDNLFPEHINERAKLSTTHNRILGDKINFIQGDGVVITAGQAGKLEDYLKNVNSKGEDIDCVLGRLATDYCTFGNAFLYLVKTKDFTAIEHLDATYCRVYKSKPGEKAGILYSRGFNRRNEYKTVTAFKPVFIPCYPNFEPVEGSAGVQHSIIHIKDYSPGYYYYGQIDYYAAYYSGWLDIDYHIPKYNLSRFHNSFKASGLLVVAGKNLTDKQAEELQKEIKSNYTGEGTAGKLLVAVVNDEVQAPKFIPFDDAPEGAFNELQQITNENIILAHNWHPALVLQQPGKLSNSTDIIVAFEQVYNTVIKRKQAELLRPIKRVLADLKFAFEDIAISTPTPVSFTGNINPDEVLTIDEQRKELGYEELPDGAGQKLLTKAPPPQIQPQNQNPENGNN